MSGERIDALLLAGGALWASMAVHGVALVAGGVLYDEPPDRITIELRAPSPEQTRPSSEPPAPTTAAPSASIAEPGAPTNAGDSAGAGAGPEARDNDDPVSWRQRLRRDEERFARDTRLDAQRLAMVSGFSGEPAEGVHRCGLDGAAALPDVRIRRDLSRLAPILPGRVLSDEYLTKIGEAGARRVGQRMAFDLVLPTELLTIPLLEPDVLVAVGREDRRCFVRITVGGDLFPLHLLGLPVRAVDGAGAIEAAVVDVALNIDATVEIMKVHEGSLGFSEGRLRDGEALASSMREHQGIFRAVRALSQ